MAIDIDPVQPGELITAMLLNKVIAELGEHDARLTALETTATRPGAVEITAVTPRTVQVGDFITIVGKNFGYTVGATRVRFNGVAPFEFATGSNDTVLIVKVPDLGTTLPEAGAKVQLTVSNATSTAAPEEITVKPVPLPVGGVVQVTFEGVDPDPVTPDVDADFEFQLVSEATVPATLTVSSTIVGPNGASLGWPTSVLNSTRTVIMSKQITLNPGDTKTFYVRSRIPTQTNGQQYTIQATVSGGGLTGASDETTLVIGQASNIDPKITKLAPSDASPQAVTLSGSRLTVPRGTLATVTLQADITFAGEYEVTFAAATGTAGWTLAVTDPTPPADPNAKPTLIVTREEVEAGGGTTHKILHVRALPGANAADGHAVVTLQRKGEATRRTFTFDLDVTG